MKSNVRILYLIENHSQEVVGALSYSMEETLGIKVNWLCFQREVS
jgi:hypothetical protein